MYHESRPGGYQGVVARSKIPAHDEAGAMRQPEEAFLWTAAMTRGTDQCRSRYRKE